jgi:uncharacterized protein YkwD
MKNLVILIATILSFTATAQTAKEMEMVTLVNQVRTNPKSFIPVVEAYIKTLETNTNDDTFAKIKIKGATVTKKTNNAKSYVNPMIAEAKGLIAFLKTQKSVKALTLSPALYTYAKAQSVYMDSIKTLTHAGPNGESVTKRFTKNFTLCGENCAKAETATEALLLLLIDMGNNPKGHRTNIFLKEFTQIAVGNTNNYWAQDFGY